MARYRVVHARRPSRLYGQAHARHDRLVHRWELGEDAAWSFCKSGDEVEHLCYWSKSLEQTDDVVDCIECLTRNSVAG